MTAAEMMSGPDASALPAIAVDSSTRELSTVRLHVVTGGDESGPLVVLLHGFPEFWYGWRHQLEPLIEAGYRVVVPDQRGYNRSETPEGVGAYRLRYLARDIVDLIDAAGRERAHVVGHDWGGIVAWDLATRYPEVVDRLAVINAPHPAVFQRVLRSSLEQQARSWYASLFQLPWLPERLLGANGYERLERALTETAPAGTFSASERALYRRAWRQPGVLTGMLNWYRASGRYPPVRLGSSIPAADDDQLETPTLLIWGDEDVALTTDLAHRSITQCARSRFVQVSGASHWVQHERPALVAEELVAHCSS
ncbi:alpha/beta fold family hydrolase [Natrialba hulunbeirensis JCM 10989]|uniref:Alpha/beta fold family hydrolase n=1 Tax=Natrialba hulunbeirensis JCM 10989 TaxID=1227493 RepID=L9ZJN5_9EURY|nr:alpha/beta hydrolase [Natrialba hulunbeirensis]ELY86539.1 alpha/beta fold family hydrolase [Natrialba hulunbeirensis JCM 10989]